MLRIIAIMFSVITTSFYFFPFEFIFFPGINTKMAMAGIGLILLGIQFTKEGGVFFFDKIFFLLSLWAVLISLTSLFSVFYNNTVDYSYATYIVSMWVWMSAAYVVAFVLRQVHGYLSVELVCNYLICVCAVQCVLAFTMDQYAPLKNFVDGFLGGEAFMGKAEGRLYGIGASLDVAGLRFASVLVMIGCIALNLRKTVNQRRMGWYIVAFAIIFVIGNMISRTTITGVILVLAYWIYSSGVFRLILKDYKLLWQWVIGTLVVFIPIVVYLYNHNQMVYENLRFAFEGFFSLWEKGKWEVHSNEILFEHMYVFPETFKTWIIGDGYMANPSFDPNYTGRTWHGFYMGTDVGYLRFIFYFGLIGLGIFIAFMCKIGSVCVKKFSSQKMMFLMILLVHFIGWFKVSSDIFLVFALFFMVGEEENNIYNKQIEISR